jgi:hypothetical protein
MVPRYLYKYVSPTVQALQNLKGQSIYFGSPLDFVDPNDCALRPTIRPPTDSEVEAIRRRYLDSGETPPPARLEFESLSTSDLRDALLRAANSALEATAREFPRTRGVTCFSEVNDDLLLWAHYGGRYRGMCLEFSTAVVPFEKIRKVQYVESVPALELAPLLVERNFEPVFDLFCTKAMPWSYEREWRAIHSAVGTEYVYPPEALTGVYFGPCIDTRLLEATCLILLGQNSTVKFWRGTRSETEFRLRFSEFTYTSLLEAKRKGLV